MECPQGPVEGVRSVEPCLRPCVADMSAPGVDGYRDLSINGIDWFPPAGARTTEAAAGIADAINRNT